MGKKEIEEIFPAGKISDRQIGSGAYPHAPPVGRPGGVETLPYATCLDVLGLDHRCLRSRARGCSAPSLIPPRSGQLKGKRAKLILLFHLKHLALRLCKKRKAAERVIRPKKRREKISERPTGSGADPVPRPVARPPGSGFARVFIG
jgi:hypothetical protein